MSDQSGDNSIWSFAADLLEGKEVASIDEAKAGSALLTKLEFSPTDAIDAASHHARIAFLRFAGRMSDVFEIGAPDAPGLAFVGGMTRPSMHRSQPLLDPQLSAGGRGTAFGGAFMSCAGEAIERVSQYQTQGDRLVRCSLGTGMAGLPAAGEALRELLEGRAGNPDDEIDWVSGQILPQAAECLIPADLCLVRPHQPAQAPLSSSSSLGCSAGATREDAMASGLLEVVERDAAALWWLASRPARVVPLEILCEAGVPALAEQVRRGTATRRTWFLDITSDLGIPCVAAMSFLPEGGGFAHGVAARLTLSAAAAAAFLEMCQMEVAYHLVAMKLAAGGEEKLSPADRRHRQRFNSIDPDRHSILMPALGAGVPQIAQRKDSKLENIIEQLNRHGFECIAVDLTRPEIGVPVFKLFVPGLQPIPSDVRTKRLRQALHLSANPYPVDIPLF